MLLGDFPGAPLYPRPDIVRLEISVTLSFHSVRTHQGGPPSHKEWTASLHSGLNFLPAGNLSSWFDYSVRLNSGVAISRVPIPNAKRKSRSVRIAANPPSFSRIALNPCIAYVKGSTMAIPRSHFGNAEMG